MENPGRGVCDTVAIVSGRGARALALPAALLPLALLAAACEQRRPDADRAAGADTGAGGAVYHAAGPESLGVAVAIVIDKSGSMRRSARGDPRPKNEVARAAVERALNATERFIAQRPGFPVKVAVFAFSDRVRRLLPMQPYDRDSISAALAGIQRPRGGTAIGRALDAAREEVYGAGLFRKYILVVTDGENTAGPRPAKVAREIWRRSEGGVHMHFVAFDTDPKKFGFVEAIKGSVVAAWNGEALAAALDSVYQQKILAEAVGDVEPPAPSAADSVRPAPPPEPRPSDTAAAAPPQSHPPSRPLVSRRPYPPPPRPPR
jgi:hypothetical protein